MLLKSKEKATKDEGAFSAMAHVFGIGYEIAIPAVIFTFCGRYLDVTFGTSPLFLLLGVFVFMLSSAYLIYVRIRRMS
ncbi:MAG: hypothetical protein CR972_00010 [Candidatus Moraniibacteriota bacterium]|nr:MAG: hypothetical protein CR972_00010 [Candidatus Moranbacteria bacterium]